MDPPEATPPQMDPPEVTRPPPDSQIRFPFIPARSGFAFWTTHKTNSNFMAQEYRLGSVGKLVRNVKDVDPHPFRIIVGPSQNKTYFEVAVAKNLDALFELYDWFEAHIFPKISQYSVDIQLQILPHCLYEAQKTILCQFQPLVAQQPELRLSKPYLFCGICDRLAKLPVRFQVEDNSRIYCHDCIQFEIGEEMMNATEADPEVALEISTLPVCCPFNFNGCDFEGPTDSVQHHYPKCKHSKYFCIHRGKGCSFNSQDLHHAVVHSQICNLDLQQTHDRIISARDQIPEDVLIRGCRFFDRKDILAVSLVSKASLQIARKNIIWESFYLRDFNYKVTPPPNIAEGWWFLRYGYSFSNQYGPCNFCGGTEKKATYYHPGKWHDLDFLEVRRMKLRGTLFRQRAQDGALALVGIPTSIIASAGVGLAAGAAGLVFETVQGLKEGLTEDNRIVVPRSVPMMDFAIMAGAFLYPPALIVAIPVALAYQSGVLVTKVPEVARRAVSAAVYCAPVGANQTFDALPKGITAWTCCGRLGSWADPCTYCPGHRHKA